MRGEVERFHVLYLDRRNRVISDEQLSIGTVDHVPVYPREIIKRALSHNAAALVVAHNHPSGSLTPSSQDRRLTGSLYLACSLMHIRLLDHLVVGDGHYSFADNGIMAEIERWCTAVQQQGSGI